jgi:glycosyltransferase involved in cell wall biosynthesis
MKPKFVTFLIPTLGRKSLSESIASLERQTDNDWTALAMFDGIDCPKNRRKSKVKFLQCEKQRGAGGVRNRMLTLLYDCVIPQTTWVAFLDDDDCLKETYVEKLRGHADKGDEIVLFTFRMGKSIIPRKGTTKIECYNVGISYAIRMDFLSEVRPLFHNNKIEDFNFIHNCQKAGAKVFITHDEQYICPNSRSRWRKPPPDKQFNEFKIKLL